MNERSLKYFPIQLFAVVMGLSGVTIALAKAYHIVNWPYTFYELFLFVDTVAFAVIFTAYAVKCAKYFDAVKNEFAHHVKSSFAAAISISFLLLSIAYYDYAPTVSITFWYLGTPLQLFFMLNVMKFWLKENFKVEHISPAWFIPVVGNVLVPVIGVVAAPIGVSIFYFSIGIFYWIILFAIVLYRMIFHSQMPDKLMPTMFILIAPPAVGFISYFRITFGSIDFISTFLYSIALATLLLILFNIKTFFKIKFYISWWAYTFPMAAFTIATLLMHLTYKFTFTFYASQIMLVLTLLVVAAVSYKTILAAKNGQICIMEE